jgi:hypothetical protein
MKEPDRQSQINQLLQRLERISADSRWAHLASGYRGSLLKALEEIEHGFVIDPRRLESLIAESTVILYRAAREQIRNRATRWT